MISQTSLIHAERVQIRLPTQSRTRCRIGPPNEIEYDHRAYRITYRMASWETAEKTTKRWSPRPHSDGYHCQRTSNGDREDYREPYRTKLHTKMLTEWCTEGSTNYRRTAYRTEYQTTIPKAYQMTTEKPTNILSKLPTEMATEKSTKNAPKLSSEWLSPRNGAPRPCRMPNYEMLSLANAMHKANSPRAKRALITVSMTTYCEAHVLDMHQWYTAHAQCNWRQFYHSRMVTSKSHMRTDGYDDARSGSSHQCPKSRGDPSDDRLFPISPQPIPTMVYA